MKNIAILGSTGSIGTSALRVVAERHTDFRVIGLSAYSNMKLFAQQIRKFRPVIISVKDNNAIAELRKLVRLKGIDVYTQEIGLPLIAAESKVQTLIVATSGVVSLLPVLKALRAGKTVALANKEPLVMAGHIMMRQVEESRGRIIPVDSEHSAIFQCLRGEEAKSIKKIFLTGSGGPFRGFKISQLSRVTSEQALRHPKWNMGRKITIDSATLMNKGLELIEARWLFNIAPAKIEVVIHPEAVIHSMVEFCDRSVMAQLGITDMRLPIQYALDYPRRMPNNLNPLDFFDLKTLSFFPPDERAFPCLKIAREAAEQGGSAGCAMNAANEVAVEAFLNSKIKFRDIPRVIARMMSRHKYLKHPGLEEIMEIDARTRREAEVFCYR